MNESAAQAQETVSHQQEASPKYGVLLMNLGTPDSTEVADVRRYLGEFLNDPRVIDINPIVRFLLLHLIILRVRPPKTAAAYKEIWTPQGSPLMLYSDELADKVRQRLGADAMVEVVMRYQNPPVGPALDRMKEAGVSRVVLVPLFPQNSSAAYGSAVEHVYEEAGKRWNTPALQVVDAFFDHPAYLRALESVSAEALVDYAADHYLFSFHGVPERHIRKGDDSGRSHCLSSSNCCDVLGPHNRNCYRAQCVATARSLAQRLGIPKDKYTVTFQSRFGKDPWIQPFTDEQVNALGEKGVKKLAVFCPAFVTDCLETLEEIQLGLGEEFVESGGEELKLVPSLNARDVWADAVTELVQDYLPQSWTS